ncbi:alpha/beta hydrolase [Termitidicoccus mucosus]
MNMKPAALLAILLAGVLSSPFAANAQDGPRSKLPPPDFANVSYGPHARNVMDVWLAKSAKPAPLLLYFHGGGFRAGDKGNLWPAVLREALGAGITVAAANYRLSPDVSFPGHYMDCARALQFARHSAKAWNIDPARVALIGSSAGAGTSLWIAFHDDLADRESDDPVARESTRVSCVVVAGAQPTYDPRVIREVAGEAASRHQALVSMYGLKPGEADSEKAHRLYGQAAPITYLTKDDPPVYAYYTEPKTAVPPSSRAGTGIHHPNLGLYLKKHMDALNIECVVAHKSDGHNFPAEGVAFMKKHFGL